MGGVPDLLAQRPDQARLANSGLAREQNDLTLTTGGEAPSISHQGEFMLPSDKASERVPMGRTEVWTLVNDSELPHPVHIHVGQFQVLSREGGRNRVMPWETGLKDTVLLFPRERVEVAVRFDDHPGLFLLHCHNLEHEDMGMMLNLEVVE